MSEKELLKKALEVIKYYNNATGYTEYGKAQEKMVAMEKEIQEYFTKDKEAQINLNDYML